MKPIASLVLALGLALAPQLAPAQTLAQNNEAMFQTMADARGLSSATMARIRAIFGASSTMGQGNPAMNESRSLVYLFYNEAFVLQNKAGGAAIAMFIVVLVGIMTAFQFWAQKKWVHYG